VSKIEQLRELTWTERRWLVEAWLLLLGFRVALRTRPFTSVEKAARVPLAKNGATEQDPQEPSARLIWCVDAAANNHLVPMRCLERSLTGQRMLRKRGIDAELKIGVQKQGPELEAHAWLELDGRPLNEPEAIGKRYLPLLPNPEA